VLSEPVTQACITQGHQSTEVHAFWKFISSSAWYCTNAQSVPDISVEHSAFTFKGPDSWEELQDLQTLHNEGTDYPMTQLYIPEQLNPQNYTLWKPKNLYIQIMLEHSTKHLLFYSTGFWQNYTTFKTTGFTDFLYHLMFQTSQWVIFTVTSVCLHMGDSQTNIPPICPGGGPLGWGPWPGGGPCIGGGWLWGGKPGPGWWCGMPRGNTKNKVTCQILVTQTKTLQYDMPDSWTAFSPNMECKLPSSRFQPFSTDICAMDSH